MEIRKYKTLFNNYRLPELVAEFESEHELSNVDSPKSIAKIMKDVFNHHLETEEIMYLICLDTKNNIIGIFEISHGTVNRALVSPREVLMKALICGSTSIILAHNHPSGNPEPSQEDILLTKRIDEAARLIDISLLDHIVVGNESFISLKKRNLF